MIEMQRQLVAACLLLVAATLAPAEESVVTEGTVTFRVTVDAQQAFVAQPIEFRLQVDAPRGATVQLPELAGRLGPFEVREFQTTADIPIAGTADTRRWIGRGSIESLNTGELSIPPLEVQVRLNGHATATTTLRSHQVGVRIVSLLEDRADAASLRDIKGVVDVPVPTDARRVWTRWLAGGVAALLMASLAVVYVVRRRPEVSAARWALMQLEEVEQAFGTVQTNAVESYQRLADILGEYLQLRFSPRDPGDLRNGTIDQQEIPLAPIMPELRSEIRDFLAVAEQVKFACLTISPEHVQRALGQVRELIDQCERLASQQRTEQE